MKAIRTRYSGPTNTRGSRIHATDADGNRVSISYPYHLNSGEASMLAAYRLMQKMRWPNELVSGGFGHDEYWVMLPHNTGKPMYETVLASLKETA
jgi:hypothetical protein